MTMRNHNWFKALAIVLLAHLFIFLPAPDLVMAQTNKKVLPAGTPVTIRIDQPVSSKTSLVGTQVQASVVNDVIVDGSVLIRAGSPCNAVVCHVSKSDLAGQEGNIMVEVKSISAADGMPVPINNPRLSNVGESRQTLAIILAVVGSFCLCPLAILIRGTDAEILSGMQVTGYTVSSAEIGV